MVLEAAILCAPSLREHGYEVVICGRGWEEDSLKREIADKGVSDIVKMPGYVKPHEILPSAKVLCATNLINNYPSQTIAEAALADAFSLRQKSEKRAFFLIRVIQLESLRPLKR